MSVGASLLPTDPTPVGGSSTFASESSPLPPAEPITVNEIIRYYNDDYDASNEEINKTIHANKQRQIEIRLKQINKVLPELMSKWNAPTPLHYYIAYQEKGMNTEELVLTIEDKDFQKHVDKLAKERIAESKKPKTRSSQLQKQKKAAEQHEIQETPDEDSYDSDDDEDYQDPTAPKKPIKKKRAVRTRRQQVCTIECPPEVNPKEWETWSDVHKQSYMVQKENPNTFFYRNLPPGEKQKNGAWTPEEHRLFLKRLHEIREQGIYEGKWGIFSMKIPGRVGYQCANYYRKLLLSGKVHDEYYRKDSDGKLHFKDRQSYKKGAFKSENAIKRQKAYPYLTSTKIVSESESEDEQTPTHEVGFYEKMAAQNPFTESHDDFITGEPIKVPAISPDGTVLDYNTWLKILTTTKQDPFTLRHINKRQIVILTKENYDEYKDHIKDM